MRFAGSFLRSCRPMRFLRHVELMLNLLCDFPQRTALRVDQDIGLAIERFAPRKESFDFSLWIFRVQHWAVRLMADPVPDRFSGSPQTNDERVPFQAGQIFRIDGQAATGGDDEATLVFQFSN